VTDNQALSLALPKGRLFDQVIEFFAGRGLEFEFEERRLHAQDASGLVNIILVKNTDLPTYVNHGIAGLGICGSDVVYESGLDFYRLMRFDFGGTRMCLAGKPGSFRLDSGRLTVATKFPRFTRDYFHERGVPVEIIKLNGSVELAPVLGLAPCIVDLVETGSTLKAHDLAVIETLEEVTVSLIANPAYYKVHYQKIDSLLAILKGEESKPSGR